MRILKLVREVLDALLLGLILGLIIGVIVYLTFIFLGYTVGIAIYFAFICVIVIFALLELHKSYYDTKN
jgi:hypothetical protein